MSQRAKDPVRALAKTMVGGDCAWAKLSKSSQQFWLSEARHDIANLARRGFVLVRRDPDEPADQS